MIWKKELPDLVKRIIEFVKDLKKNDVNNILIVQIIKSATSVGANYVEADGAESKKDFYHKIGICKKETKETKHWLRMIAKANENKKEECRKIWHEAQELTFIFSSIFNKKDQK